VLCVSTRANRTYLARQQITQPSVVLTTDARVPAVVLSKGEGVGLGGKSASTVCCAAPQQRYRRDRWQPRRLHISIFVFARCVCDARIASTLSGRWSTILLGDAPCLVDGHPIDLAARPVCVASISLLQKFQRARLSEKHTGQHFIISMTV
jgi:hypothetical protein